ncbi:MAG: formate/nitrite transporter family protein [Deltaproteobacteria bacterium]|nr:formate/nitrite transporter family protein [Deltaproteobacteria bacterium]MBW2341133.1 formate/nitrite transporter family protein [Deltaproteobacteria bacterium]
MAERMLIIDDEEIVLESCRKIFTAEGFDVVITPSPQEGLRLASNSSFDVILCDWKMPGFDGMDVVEELDRRSPDSSVVMISGYPTVGRAAEAMKRGAMDYVPKPFTPDEIAEVVKKAVRRKVTEEKKALGRFEKIIQTLQFPTPALEDKPPKTIAETVASTVGVSKVTSPWVSVFVLGILAGAYIGFGGLLSTAVSFDLANTMGIGFKKFMAGTAFSVGLILVVIAGAELFTGNNLMISSAMSKKITFGTMSARWGVVWFANLVGSLILALMLYFSGLWKTGHGALGASAVGIAYAKVNLSFIEALVRAIGCNWLVCLAVWMALAARQTVGKIFAIYFPIMAFVAIGFEHVVANMYFIPAGIFLHTWAGIAGPATFDPSSLNWISFLWKNMVPVTIGNIIGGAVFVGMSYWGAYLRPSSEDKGKV